jgi:ubiquinone/menaquinone biosynthesis C-methylase UbiE
MSNTLPRQFGNLEANIRFLDQTGVIRPGVAVLEIGAGTGAMLDALARMGCRVQGVEVNPELIAEAAATFTSLPIQRVSGVELPFPDATFDVAVSFDVFEHIPDSDAHLREVRRVLRPGGSYLIQTPNKWPNMVFETIRWRSLRFRADHCSLHTLGQLTRRLRSLGFEARVHDVPVVNAFFREKVRKYAGAAGTAALTVVNPDRLPLQWRTNLFVHATLR